MNPQKPGEMADFQPEEEAHLSEPSPIPPVSTFVVRFWLGWSHSGLRWRGRIEHVQSGQGLAFQDLERMLAFMRSTGPPVDDVQPSRQE